MCVRSFVLISVYICSLVYIPLQLLLSFSHVLYVFPSFRGTGHNRGPESFQGNCAT